MDPQIDKQCTGCKQTKSLNEFGKDKYEPDGFTCQCKACRKISSQKWKEKNKDRAKAKNKEWRDKNKEYISECGKEYRRKNPDYCSEYYQTHKVQHGASCKKWNEEHAEELREKERERAKTDIAFRLKTALRKRLYQAIRNGYKTGSAVSDLGCSIEFLKQHLELKFYPNPETGEMMSWDNYGKWHIDHIIPLATFDLTDIEQLKKACNYSNLQPLWAKENLSKGAKY